MTSPTPNTGIQARFQVAMERAAFLAGQWWHFAFWGLACLIWLGTGPIFHFSDSWNLAWNGVSTTLELFLGLALLVDGSAQITMLVSHNQRMEEMLAAVQQVLAHVQDEATQIETGLTDIDLHFHQQQHLTQPPAQQDPH